MISAILLLALMADPAPAGATPPVAPAPAAAPAPTPAPKAKTDELVCHTEKELGSNLTHHVCRRQSDIDARAAQDRETLEQIQSGTRTMSGH